MTLFRYLFALVIYLAPVTGGAGETLPAVLSAPQVHQMQAKGRILLIDIRSPNEWRQTGVAPGALTITLHRRNFAHVLLAAMGGDKSRAIALICATGGRTALAQRLLKRLGFTAVVDVSEGMLGSPSGPGWIRRGLPVIAYRSG